MTNSASRWRKIAKNLPQDLIHYTTRKAFAVEFEVLRSSVVQAACSSSLLRFHFQRRSLSCRSKLIQVARWPLCLPPRFGCPLSVRRSAMAKRKSGGCRFSNFFVWAKWQNLFLDQNTRAAENLIGKLQTQWQIMSHRPVYLIDINYVTIRRLDRNNKNLPGTEQTVLNVITWVRSRCIGIN